ncbi:SoxR reducing system RseC family protein [Paraferrimonas sp. SM1919]|uniref:SoxR reducing system RseC family protein n=1 Tax=Paraferrimonas sp. SM1919 TaxID=2662263 RepID=UPI0013D0B8F2|nr:SoxR reducing system RseC family protein [Paraferrimonas sp. SM1919]
MMQELAKVVAQKEGVVFLEIRRKSACGQCQAQDNCGTATVAKAFKETDQVLSIKTEQQFTVGDMLQIGLPEAHFLEAAATVYLLPLAGLVVGASLGHYVAMAMGINLEITAMLGATLGGIGSYLFSRKKAQKIEVTPKILANLGQQSLKRG